MNTAALESSPADLEHRVLVLAPTANDALLTSRFLSQSGITATVCTDIRSLSAEVRRGCSAVVLAEEILGQSPVADLIQILSEQPAWSDVPLILITSGGEASQTRLRRLATFGPGGNVTLLERPFRPGTLLSAVEVAMRARRRQYQARDSIKELERVHAEAEAASQAKDDFLAALSHELRTPLNPVLLVSSDRSGNSELPPDVRADFEMIRKNVELEARLIDDLLDLTRISRGKLHLKKLPEDVHEILRDAVAKVEEEIKRKNISFNVDLAATRSVVSGDAVRLQQVFWNILKNAVKFTAPGGRVTLETRSASDEGLLTVRITDTGIGLTRAEIARIFDAFSQGDHAASLGPHRFGGLGLGLAISRVIVDLHDGCIRAASDGRERGATFTVELPCIEHTGPKKTARGDALPGHSSRATLPGRSNTRVLLVEDHEPTRTALAGLLVRRHYKVITASSVSEALERAGKQPLDIVIADIGLPDGSGYSLMSELRDSFGLKGIALTGYGMEQDVVRGQNAGFVAHLVKPIHIDSLEKALAESW